MALKTFKPTTPSLRQLVIVDRSELYKGKPVKTLTEGKTSKGGRNNHGRVTVRFRGGGHKQSYRLVDFKRRKLDVVGKVERIEYDPNRTAFIALIRYADNELAYILAPQRLSVGNEVVAGQQVDVKPGNAMPVAAAISESMSWPYFLRCLRIGVVCIWNLSENLVWLAIEMKRPCEIRRAFCYRKVLLRFFCSSCNSLGGRSNIGLSLFSKLFGHSIHVAKS